MAERLNQIIIKLKKISKKCWKNHIVGHDVYAPLDTHHENNRQLFFTSKQENLTTPLPTYSNTARIPDTDATEKN